MLGQDNGLNAIERATRNNRSYDRVTTSHLPRSCCQYLGTIGYRGEISLIGALEWSLLHCVIYRVRATTRRQMNPAIRNGTQENLADDLLRGADEIAGFLYGDTTQRRKVYHLAETSRLPVFRLGSKLCARRSVLMAWIASQEQRGWRAHEMQSEPAPGSGQNQPQNLCDSRKGEQQNVERAPKQPDQKTTEVTGAASATSRVATAKDINSPNG
jgi:hypothetical protein